MKTMFTLVYKIMVQNEMSSLMTYDYFIYHEKQRVMMYYFVLRPRDFVREIKEKGRQCKKIALLQLH